MAFTTTDKRDLVRRRPDPDRADTPESATETLGVPVMALVTVASGVTLVIGSLLPWTTATFASIGTVSATGMTSFGIVTLILGLIVTAGGLVMMVRRDSSIARIVALATAVAAMYVALVSFTTAQAFVNSVNLGELAFASIGIGVLLVVLGAIGSLIGAGGSFIGAPARSTS